MCTINLSNNNHVKPFTRYHFTSNNSIKRRKNEALAHITKRGKMQVIVSFYCKGIFLDVRFSVFEVDRCHHCHCNVLYTVIAVQTSDAIQLDSDVIDAKISLQSHRQNNATRLRIARLQLQSLMKSLQ